MSRTDSQLGRVQKANDVYFDEFGDYVSSATAGGEELSSLRPFECACEHKQNRSKRFASAAILSGSSM